MNDPFFGDIPIIQPEDFPKYLNSELRVGYDVGMDGECMVLWALGEGGQILVLDAMHQAHPRA